MQAIETAGLTKLYGRSRGILDIDLQVAAGEVFGFIGPNGAGKTTTIRTLLNFLFPSRGRASIFGLDCVRDSLDIRRRVGYVPGEVGFYPGMRVREFLVYAASFHSGEAVRRIGDLSARFELDLDRRLDDLSFGNRKKAALVQAFLHQPPLLILDEPTSGLDPLMQKRFFDLVREENRRGTTVFLSSHILDEVERLCDRVALVKEGRLLTVESIGRLKERTYRKVELRYPEEAQAAASILPRLPGVDAVTQENHGLRFHYRGDIRPLMQALAGEPIEDIRVEEPSLEEIVLHAYEGGGGAA